MSPRQGNTWLRRLAAMGAVALTMVAAPVAVADEVPVPTTQATAYNADWVPYLDPPAKPAAVCLVDSGVNITPDTPADSPEGPIVKRLALDGGPGTAANETWEGLHGTRMAFVGAAPVNGWGAVGFWPGLRVVSIRAMPTDQTALPFDSYSRAIGLCTKEAANLNVVAVNLSLACECTPSDQEVARLAVQIGKAHANGLSVVAAAGNRGAAVSSPSSQPGIVGVAAGDKNGDLCSFSNRGTGVDLVAPGCDAESADPLSGATWSSYASGTSGSSITASAAMALLRSFRPDLGWQAAEDLLTASGRPTPSGPQLDLVAAFRAAGLSDLVDQAMARAEVVKEATPPYQSSAPAALPDQTNGAIHDNTPVTKRLARPRVGRVARRGRRLTVTVRNRPAAAVLRVELKRPYSEFGQSTVRRRSYTTSTIRLDLPHSFRRGQLVLRYVVGQERSAPFDLKVER